MMNAMFIHVYIQHTYRCATWGGERCNVDTVEVGSWSDGSKGRERFVVGKWRRW
jgi:hypothetical protein